MTDTIGTRSEAKHVDAFGAQERHAGLIRFGGDPGPGEVLAQVRADLSQDVDHSAGGGVCSLWGVVGSCGCSGAELVDAG